MSTCIMYIARTITFALTIVTSCSISMAAAGRACCWLPWTCPTRQTASAFVPGRGSIDVSVQGALTSTTPFQLQFDDVPFSPMVAPAAGVGNAALLAWSFQIDLTSISQTSGLILGLGNFGYGTTDY